MDKVIFSSLIIDDEKMIIFYDMTRFQLILPVHSQNVAKNLTGHNIHVAGHQIYQINRQTNIFQNMCDML